MRKVNTFQNMNIIVSDIRTLSRPFYTGYTVDEHCPRLGRPLEFFTVCGFLSFTFPYMK